MTAAMRKRIGVTKSDELIEAEQAGHAMLNAHCRAKQGNQAYLSRATDLLPTTLSNMCHGKTAINLEAAILIEVASGGALPAEKLCPSRAELLTQLMQQRAAKTAE